MTAKDTGPKARLPRGFADRSAADIRASEQMIAAIRRVTERYGFAPVETPFVEYTDALGKFLPDLDRPNEGVFSFQDDGQEAVSAAGATGTQKDEWLSLRYDLTAPLARYVAENYDKLPKPYRSYRFGWVFRNEKPGPGRFRQFMQFDADTVGASSPAADAEMCMMAADALEEVGIPRGQYVIKVNSRKVLDGYMAKAGLGGVQNAQRRLRVLRAIDKRDRLGAEAVRLLMGPGRRDDSGDWTPGAELSKEQIDIFFDSMLSGSGRHYDDPKAEGYETGFKMMEGRTWVANYFALGALAKSLSTTDVGSDGVAELQQMADIFGRLRYRDRIDIDPSVVRGLEYYTGPVFEAELLLQIPNDQGQPVVFGSVGGGGRYDGLVGRFLGEDVPATGFSIGVSRLQAALTALGKIGAAELPGPVVVLVLDRDRLADYQAMVANLRGAGIAAEMYLGDSGMRAQMKYADRRNAPLAIIQGGDEKARGVVQIKDLALGKKLSAAVADNKEWREERPGQEEIREADLVEAVNRMLGRGERRSP